MKTCPSITALAAQNDELEAAIRVAQQLLNSDEVVPLREGLRILLRALDAEPDGAPALVSPSSGGDQRCPAAHVEDPTPCRDPIVVTVLDRHDKGADGCEWHGARLLASVDGARVYGLPHARPGTASRVFKAADGMRPFAWVERP
ncbi:hypothetical protein [Streptomyces sp. NPDC001500]